MLRLASKAVPCVLIGLALARFGAAGADEPTVAELTTPTNTVELGATAASSDSVKASEYDGLTRKGPYAIGNFDLRGGGSYDSNDATRWRLLGTNLGLETRDVQVEYGVQGKYRLSFGFDDLLRNGSAVYQNIQTPYQGTGGQSLALPSNWSAPAYPSGAAMGGGNAYPAPSGSMLGLAATGYSSPLVTNTNFLCRSGTHGCQANSAFNGALTTGLPVTPANTALLQQNATDLGDFHTVALSTKREKEKYAVAYELASRWTVAAGMQSEDKHGLKPLGVVNASNGPGTSFAAENSVIIPQVINTTTDQYNASLNFKGERSFATLAYYGSMFQNNARSMTVADPYGINTNASGVGSSSAYGISSATISEEPNNTFNQMRLTGGYDLAPATRLVADAAFGRNAQNDSYVLDPGMFLTPTLANGSALTGAATNNGTVVPANSANAVIVTKSLDLKLTARPFQKLSLGAAYKYDDRDNRTPVNTYVWYDAGVKQSGAATNNLNGAAVPDIAAGTALYGGANIVANRPYSKKVNQLDADADYALARGQAVKAGVGWQSIDRGCSGTWIDCSYADRSHETTGKLEYKYASSGSLSGHIGFDYGVRKVDYNPNAWMALAPGLGATNIPSLTALGYSGSVLGFLNANGLTPYGLPIGANAPSGLAGSTLAVYQKLFGNGNGGLTNGYYGVNNVTQNWPGLDVYNMANRKRDRLRGALTWQASDTFTLQTGLDYRHETYPDSVYGLQSTGSWALNLDGDLVAGEDLTLDGYYTHEDQKSTSAGDSASNGSVSKNASVGVASVVTGNAFTNAGVSGGCISQGAPGLSNPTPYQVYNNNAKISQCAGWQSEMRERTDTLGLAFNKKRLVWAKVSLSGDVSVSRALATNAMNGGFYYANAQAAYVAGVPAIYYVNATATPDVVITSVQLRLMGGYQLTKASSVRVAYSFRHLQTSDYTYASTQPAYTSSTVMPVMAQSPDYNVSAVGLSYVLTFQ